jgi:hypothetical protein
MRARLATEGPPPDLPGMEAPPPDAADRRATWVAADAVDPEVMRATCARLRAQALGGANVAALREEHADFLDRHPALFHKLVDAQADLGPLETLLGMLGRVRGGDLDEHAADVRVGQMMFDRFSRPA